MKPICLFFISICLFACSTKNKKEKQNHRSNNKGINVNDSNSHRPSINKISQLDEDSCTIHWYGGGLFSLCFEKNKVKYFFTPQCIYWYRTKLEKDKLIFFWSYNEDCVFDRGLHKDYGLKMPVVGAPFGEFTLLDDTTLQVKYYFADWVAKVNEHAKDVDTLFPKYFKMKRK